MAKKWYVVHTQSGCEEKVKAGMEQKIIGMEIGEYVSRIIVPMEEVTEIKRGKKQVVRKKSFPGYVLVEVELTEQVESFIRNMKGVTGFVGAGRKPVPLEENEIEDILKPPEEKKAKVKPESEFSRSDVIRIVEGPFLNFNGTVDEVFPDKEKLKAMISIFGRSTPVELEYWQVEKV